MVKGGSIQEEDQGGMSEGERTPPHNLEAEMSVLSAMLLHRDALVDVLQRLEPKDFYKQAHVTIFEAMRDLYDRNVEIDTITLAEELESRGVLAEIGGNAYLLELSEFVPTAASAIHHAEIVRSKSVVRSLIDVCTEIARRSYEGRDAASDLLDEAEKEILEIARQDDVGEPKSMHDLVWDTFRKIESFRGRGGKHTGVPSGFIDLDEYTSGFQPGELIIIAARPSMGKTSFAINVMDRAAESGFGAAFFSLEMTSEQLTQNLLCAAAQVDAHKMRRGFLSGIEFERLQEKASEFYQRKIFIDETAGLSILNLRAKARRLKQKEDIGLVIIDYLQLVSAGGRVESRQQEISMISRSLKALAKELQIPVIALSQLNRGVEQRDNHRPRMSDLRESGAIEQDADVVMMLHREEYYKPTEENRGIAELILAKQRNGPTGTVKLRFFREFMRFENYVREAEPLH